MRRKFRPRVEAKYAGAVIFLLFGIAFLVLFIVCIIALVLHRMPDYIENTGVLLWMLFSFGGMFVWGGSVGVLRLVRSLRRQREAFENGSLVFAEVTDVIEDRSIRINGKSPLYAQLLYTDERGFEHLFITRNLKRKQLWKLEQEKVPVYLIPDVPDKYYVDLDSILKPR